MSQSIEFCFHFLICFIFCFDLSSVGFFVGRKRRVKILTTGHKSMAIKRDLEGNMLTLRKWVYNFQISFAIQFI